MSIPGLTIIGESINDSVPTTHSLFEACEFEGIVELAKQQGERGATYIDVNVGARSPDFMATVIRKIQDSITLPLSIDTPDLSIAAAGLEAYSPERAGNRRPILNSISEARPGLFDLFSVQPFIPLLLITECVDTSGNVRMNRSPDQGHRTATSIVETARRKMPGLQNEEIILDPGITPIGSDANGDLKRLMETLALIHQDKDLAGVRISVGLSNFTAMLPSKRADGSPVKSPLESAFLTMAMPLGLNTIIGSVKRQYFLLPEDDPAMQCLRDVLNLQGVEAVMRVMMYFS